MITIDPTNNEQLKNLCGLEENLYSLNCGLRFVQALYRVQYDGKKADLRATKKRLQKRLKKVNTLIKILGGSDEIIIQYPTDAAPDNATSELVHFSNIKTYKNL